MIAGGRIKEERIKLNLSQEELGELLGVSKVSVCGYEKGTRTPTLEIFVKLMDILKIGPYELLNRDINVICENDEAYSIKISKEELNIINALRKNENLYHEILNKIN